MSGSQWSPQYEIRVAEVLNGSWSTWFEGLEVREEMGQTVVFGSIPDQSALHGVLEKIRDLGLHLIAVRRVGPGKSEKQRRVEHVVLRGKRVLLRRGRAEDVERLSRIRGEPEVGRWWGSFEPEELLRDFVESPNGFVMDFAGEVVGGIQYSEENDPMYRHASIDVFIASSWRGQGLGVDAVRALAQYLLDERDHHRLTIDPAADNASAIRAYERVGFRKVGVMHQYERAPDGSWRDGLLMERLRKDFGSRSSGNHEG